MSLILLDEGVLIFNLYVQPKASRDALVGWHDGALKVAITAPPVDGKANKHLVQFLAKTFMCAKSNVEIVKGDYGRHKRVKITEPKFIPELLKTIL